MYFAYQGVKLLLLFGKFGVICFLVTAFMRFAFLPYYWQNAHTSPYRNITESLFTLEPHTLEQYFLSK